MNKIEIVWGFKYYIHGSNHKPTGTPSSYVRALEILSIILKRDLFLEKDLDFLEKLYDDLVVHQRNPKGKYSYPSAPSYGAKGFLSAAVRKYMDFISTMLYSNLSSVTDKRLSAVLTNKKQLISRILEVQKLSTDLLVIVNEAEIHDIEIFESLSSRLISVVNDVSLN
jgi:hypothetical protein